MSEATHHPEKGAGGEGGGVIIEGAKALFEPAGEFIDHHMGDLGDASLNVFSPIGDFFTKGEASKGHGAGPKHGDSHKSH